VMDINNEPIITRLFLLITLLQSLCFHIEMPPFSGFMLNVVIIDIKEIVVMLVYLHHKITYNLGLLPTKLGHWVHSPFHAHEFPNLLHMKFCFSEPKLLLMKLS
jgi:hypothetical protein